MFGQLIPNCAGFRALIFSFTDDVQVRMHLVPCGACTVHALCIQVPVVDRGHGGSS